MRPRILRCTAVVALLFSLVSGSAWAHTGFWQDTGLAIQLGLYPLAEKRLKDYRPKTPQEKARRLLALGYVYLREHEEKKAAQCLSKIPPSSPYHDAAQALSWKREMEVEEVKGVISQLSPPYRVFTEILSAHPAEALDYLLLNKGFLLPGEEKKGIKAAFQSLFWKGEDERVLAIFNRFPWLATDKDAVWKAALVHYRRGELLDALSLLSTLTPKARVLFWKAKILKLMGMRREAQHAMKEASAEKGFYAFLAQVSLGRVPKAHLCLRKAIAPPAPLRELVEMGMEDVAIKVVMNRLWAREISTEEALALLSPINPALAMKIRGQRGSGQNCLLYPYRRMVEAFCKLYGVEVPLAYAIMRQESLYDRMATSSSGALGLMQVLPSTGSFISQELGEDVYIPEKLYVPIFGIRYGIWYLGYLEKQFPTLPLVAAAYNAGPTVVGHWYRQWRMGSAHEVAEFFPKGETRIYVRRVITYYLLYSAAN